MVGDAGFEQAREVFADNLLLLNGKLKWIGRRQQAREFGGHGFGGLPARSENQNRAEIFSEGFGDEARPVTANFPGNVVIEIVRVDFFKRNRALIVTNQDGFASEAREPFHDVLRVGYAAAQEQ